MLLRSIFSLCTAVSFVLAGGVARADTITQTFFTGPLQPAGIQNIYFNAERFDPALGSLVSVGASLSGSFSVYNPAGYGFFWHTLGFNPGEPILYGRNYIDTVTGSYVVRDTNILVDGPTFADVTGNGLTSPSLLLNLNHAFVINSSGLTVTLSYNYTPAVTPEPSSLLLLGTGMVGVVGVARRRFRR